MHEVAIRGPVRQADIPTPPDPAQSDSRASDVLTITEVAADLRTSKVSRSSNPSK